jgi:hypothetical protein
MRRHHVLLALIALVLAPGAVAAGATSAAQQLAERHAPVVVVRTPSDPCDGETEPYRPTPVETVLGNPEIPLRDDDGSVIDQAPTAAEVAGKGPKTWLDLPGNPRRPGCGYAKDFARLSQGHPDVVYAHIATDPSAPGRLALQYWMFWYFDDFVNTHEGDWEFVQVVFDAATPEEALATAPVAVGYSQHSGGERAGWTDPDLEREGDHPVVYVAAGSHANFMEAATFLGRSADEGFGCDRTGEPSTRLLPGVHLLPTDAADAAPADRWLLFHGRWGEFQPSPYDAPPGPATKEEWTRPIAWQDTLRDSSFSIPSGGTFGPAATTAFCVTVRAGGQIYTAITSPLVLVLLVVGLVAAGTAALRSTDWTLSPSPPLVRRRESGQILREARHTYRRHRTLMIALGGIFVPAAIVETVAGQALFERGPIGALVETAGNDSLASAAVALLVAGAGHLVASALVLGAVASALGAADRARTPTIREAYELLAGRIRSLLAILAVATLIVLLLLLTVVGAIVAVYLLGRWAVSVQASAVEGLTWRAALRRSAQLTRGRWWRTVRLAAVVNALGLVSGPAVGIVLLFVTSLPLATINAISSVVYVGAMPFVGAAMALLYGDLMARERTGEVSRGGPVLRVARRLLPDRWRARHTRRYPGPAPRSSG